jgi:hypothetical protein
MAIEPEANRHFLFRAAGAISNAASLGNRTGGPIRPSGGASKENDMTEFRGYRGLIAATGLAITITQGGAQALAAEPTVIELTQTPCQFLESENGIDRGFTSARKADCEAINARTGTQRLADAKVLKLKPGKYIFRVSNKNVPYGLGFWLRGDGFISRATLPSVSGGGLATGTTKDYAINLEPGEYVYSCPLNPTPDYKIIVEG